MMNHFSDESHQMVELVALVSILEMQTYAKNIHRPTIPIVGGGRDTMSSVPSQLKWTASSLKLLRTDSAAYHRAI